MATNCPVIGITSASFTVNGTQRQGVSVPYIAAVRDNGGLPVLLPSGRSAFVALYLNLIDGLLIPGEADVDPALYGQEPHPTVKMDKSLDEIESALIRGAFELDMPMLAICRGIQSLNVALGGSLIQDLPSEHESAQRHEVRENGRSYLAHTIRLEPEARVTQILGREDPAVNSFHHQAIRELAPSLTATGWSDDGIVEAAEAPDKTFVIGLQCHPEEIWNTTAPEFARLFAAFVEACQARRRAAPGVSQ